MKQVLKKYLALLLIISFMGITTFIYFPQKSLAGSVPSSMHTVKVPQAPEPVSRACTTKSLIDFGVATLFKATTGAVGGNVSVLGFSFNPFPDITQDTTIDFWDCVQGILDAAAKVALAKFRKNLLDRITDDTIAWINGDKPKYITDFGKLLSDSANSAIGETLTEVGGSNICKPLRFSINLKLSKQTPFTEQTSCTLNNIVDNISDFKQNFSSGGWIGYSEALKPRNNPFGLSFLVQQEIWKKDQEKSEKQLTEAISNNGFKPTEQCTQWAAYVNAVHNGITGIQKITEITPPVIDNDTNIDPNVQPTPAPILNPVLQNEYKSIDGQLLEPYWKCVSTEINTPAKLVEATAVKAVTQDSDYIINSNELSPYISAIFDAAVNRLIKSGVKGLQGAFIQSDTSTGRQPTQYDPSITRDRNTIDEGNNYGDSINPTGDIKNQIETIIASSTELIDIASSTLQEVIDLNTDISNTTSTTLGYRLLSCEINILGTQWCPNTRTTVDTANDLLNQLSTEETNIINAKNSIEQIGNTIDTLSEDELNNSLVSLNSIISELLIKINVLKNTKSNLENTQLDFQQKLDLCLTPGATYVCSN